MSRPFAKIGIALVAGFILLGAFGVLHPLPALAQVAEGLETVGEQTGLSDTDPKEIVANIIRAVLGTLGVIAVLIVLYGGWVWMTSGGNEEKVVKAKKILVRGAIGLAIILLSYTITIFIFNAILDSTNGGGGSGSGGGDGSGGFGGGSGTSFVVSDYSPEGVVSIRNVEYRVTFSRRVDEDTIDGNITITNDATGEDVAGTWDVSGSRASFTPSAACPSPNEDRYCFDADTTYSVEVTTDVQSSTGASLVCSGSLCSSSFTTGSLVDTEDPEAEFTVPDNGDGIPTDSTQVLQVSATDDSEVSGGDFSVEETLIATAGAEGGAEATIDALWDTTGLTNGERYKVSVVVEDIAGNTTEDSVTVNARPATCFNGVLDGEETDIDCGGDSGSAEYCGACDGSACTEDAECSSGSCVDGACVSLPEIGEVSPLSGAPGTYVTIMGSGFGGDAGEVAFTSATGTTVASVAACSDGWSDDEIVVEVPDDAIDGPIIVTTEDGNSDATDDTAGALIGDFDVNEVERPKLCSLSPNTGEVGAGVTIEGYSFGDEQGASTVLFGDTEVRSYSAWGDTEVRVTVPSMDADVYEVTLVVDGVGSNALEFGVNESEAVTPSILDVTPSSGAIGQYVTMTGTSFGESTGTVWFTSVDTGYSALAETDFPEACSEESVWQDDEIIVIVPSEFSNGDAVTSGAYELTVRSADGEESAAVDFTIEDGDPDPSICGIDPEGGLAGTAVTLSGEYFGSDEGVVTFTSGIAASIVADWGDEEIVLTVPSGVTTGPVQITSADGAESNTVNFEVGETDVAAASAGPATYAWYFSTGDIPSVPEVVIECSDDVVSAVPNTRFTDGVCTNAVVYAEFTELMDETTLESAVTVERCTGSASNPCASTAEAAGTLTTGSSASTSYIEFIPDADWETSTTYRVTIADTATTVASATGDVTPLAENVTWQFTTGASDAPCAVDSVRVSPSSATIEEQYATEEFRALPTAGCVVLESSDYTWSWSADESYVSFASSDDGACDGGTSSCATVQGNAEGTTDVEAMELASAIAGVGDLLVNFTDPYVRQYQPDCTEACSNAVVGATFSTTMDEASVEGTGMVMLYSCDNELCVNLTEMGSYTVTCADDGDDDVCEEMEILHSGLTPGTFYRAVISGEVVSTSGIPLTRTNYGSDYSWTFRAREDDALCAVERLAITPDTVTVTTVGDREAFEAHAYGAPDACSVEGQELAATDYSWSWTDPIEDDGANASIEVAEWWSNGAIDTDVSDIQAGCTASCISGGSEAYNAICGNDVIESGEDCDDGGALDGDGCSSSCLREGGDVVGVCGDGAMEQVTATGAGEDCDDGNTTSGDGCSSTCLNEGASRVGAVCGNNDIAYSFDVGGEECDDGNVQNGDGCSKVCLNEGSVTSAEINGAMCGNGTINTPYENCDDGNEESGDGCSERCLLEGSSVSYASVCGDGTLGTGEECDEGDDDTGDGCSADCLREGSSLTYATPSVCGDGVVGTGELTACESGGGDGYVDSLQLASITDEAAQEVDPDTNAVTASIVVTEPTSGLSTAADFTLLCSAVNDLDCADPSAYGVGVNNCCVARPEVTLSPSGADVCRNAAIYGIFTQEMDLSTFMVTNTDRTQQPRMYAALDLSASGLTSCPDGHTTLALAPHGWFNRHWSRVRSWVMGAPAFATAGDCVVEVESFTQTAEDDGTYRVTLEYATALQANATYMLVVEGDDDYSDNEADGVLSAAGAAMYVSGGTSETTFVTGADICTLDEVQVEDTDDNAYSFTQINEAHDFTAAAISYANGTSQEITALAGEYAWEWTSWTDDGDVVATTQDSASTDQAEVQALGENGNATVMATATITADTLSGTTGETVTGTARVTALLCENPWPDIDVFPWEDNATGGANGNATEGSGWMNFSTYYCRDAGAAGGDGDYDSATPVLAEVRQGISDDTVLKEYLLEIGTGGDAIGIRVAQNPEYLSPSAWFVAQGFSGDLQETTVDGFAAVTDGRTTYVSAPNMTDDGDLYANIYVISYNEGASEDTIAVYNQVLENFHFATNVASDGLCYDASDAPTDTVCDDDSDCDGDAGEYCGDDVAKLRRDTQRLADMTDMTATVAAYGAENGQCSATTSQFCSEDSECPSGETCEAIAPALSSGTYVRGLAASTWASWTDALEAALDGDALSTDPLNTYSACSEGYNASTCVDEARGAYTCPENSYAYHYRALGAQNYAVYADLEFGDGVWVNDIASTDAAGTIVIGGASASTTASGFSTSLFCDGSTYGTSTYCGDGVIGGSEVCEVGDLGGTAEACDADTTDSDTTENGTRSQVCNSACTAWTTDTSITCAVATCGNGVVDSGEECDDGDNNGRYGYCGSQCDYETASYCGDGVLSGSEACDCGSPSMTSAEFAAIEDSARPYGGTPGGCADVNGTYSENAGATCAWDCGGPANYCGDSAVTDGETCDGASESYADALCSDQSGSWSAFYASSFQVCTTTDDCPSGETCGDGDASDFSDYIDACPETTVCVAGRENMLGHMCDEDSDCHTRPSDADGECSTIAYQTYRTISCGEAGDADACELESLFGTVCEALGSCGDGTVDENEECDDGNDDSSDACTNMCTSNVCGDGYLYVGEEQCDEGDENGEGCDANYESSCTACSDTCRYVAASGEFCGDGTINGDEFCDAYDLPYYWYDENYELEGYLDGDGVVGTCDPAYVNMTYVEVYGESYEFTNSDGGIDSSNPECLNVGVCNGGTDNGEACTTDAACGSASCVFPTCNERCSASCPFTYEGETTLITSNAVGARASSSVELYGYSADTTSDLPNAATITVPACSALSSITADIAFAPDELPATYVVFITSLANSMQYEVHDDTSPESDERTRLEVAQDVMEDAVDRLYEEMPGEIYVGAIGYKGLAGGECYVNGDGDASSLYGSSGRTCTIDSSSGDDTCDAFDGVDDDDDYCVDDDASVASEIWYGNLVDFLPSSDASTLLADIESYFVDPETYYDDGLADASDRLHGVFTTQALEEAELLFQGTGFSASADNVRFVAVLLTDDVTTTGEASDVTVDWDTNGYELYTIAMGDDADLLTELNNGSSNNYDGTSTSYTADATVRSSNSVDYSYDADTESGIEAAYEEIVDALVGLQVGVVSSDVDGDGETELDTATIQEGVNVELPWPSGFVCDPGAAQDLPIRLWFSGDAQIEVSNVQVNYCAP